MKAPTFALTALLATAAWASVPAQSTAVPGLREQAFKPGGRVSLDLSAGGYLVRGTSDEAIRVRWKTRDPNDMAQASAEIAVGGRDATVRVRGPKHNFSVEIDVPRRTDLILNLSAGDLDVLGIEGNKEVSMWAGDVTIEVGDGSQYRLVDASVRFGDLAARPFGRNTGGILRSVHWTGTGKYTINAKLFAGELKLVK
jgi:hypothetical protein